jgi:hypothetical protein
VKFAKLHLNDKTSKPGFVFESEGKSRLYLTMNPRKRRFNDASKVLGISRLRWLEGLSKQVGKKNGAPCVWQGAPLVQVMVYLIAFTASAVAVAP